jgi:hypothetical protein
MPSAHSIQLRFIRRTSNGLAENDPLLDDLLVIHKLGENNLRITYTERTIDGEISDTTLMTYQRMIHYVSRILWLLSLDSDPFNSVQVMVPGYPTVLILVSRIQEQAITILDLLANTCWHWPAAGRVRPLNSLRRTRLAAEPTVTEMIREARGAAVPSTTHTPLMAAVAAAVAAQQQMDTGPDDDQNEL